MEFQSKKLVPNLDTKNLTVDPALAVVGGSSKDADEAQWSSANKAKKKAEAVHILCEELHRGGEVGPEHQRGSLHGITSRLIQTLIFNLCQILSTFECGIKDAKQQMAHHANCYFWRCCNGVNFFLYEAYISGMECWRSQYDREPTNRGSVICPLGMWQEKGCLIVCSRLSILGVFGYFGGTENGTSGARSKILRPLFNTNTPPKTPI